MGGGWESMKHFSVGFQFPGCIVAMVVSSVVAVYTKRWAGITNSFGFQASSQFDSETRNSEVLTLGEN